jgi:hypothetical protein
MVKPLVDRAPACQHPGRAARCGFAWPSRAPQTPRPGPVRFRSSQGAPRADGSPRSASGDRAAPRVAAAATRTAVRALALAVLGGPPLACNDRRDGDGASGAGSAFATGASTLAAAAQVASAASSPRPRAGRADDATHALLLAADDLSASEARKYTRYMTRRLEEQLDANVRSTAAVFAGVNADLVAQVKTGLIDAAQWRADEARLGRALQGHFAKEAETLNELHAALDAADRGAIVVAVRTARPARNDENARVPAGSAAPAAPGATPSLDRLVGQLVLDPGQRQQVGVLLARRELRPSVPIQSKMGGAQRRIEEMLSCFKLATFEAKEAWPPPGAMTPQEEQIDRELVLISRLLPLLSPQQRERFAESIDAEGVAPFHDDDAPPLEQAR